MKLALKLALSVLLLVVCVAVETFCVVSLITTATR